MEVIENENISKTIVCNKGDILLSSYIFPENKQKAYQLTYDLNNLNPEKINIKNLLSHNIYELIEKINPELIEKIHILNVYNENEADILLFLKHIAKEVGIKQKYILFRTTRTVNLNNNSIQFTNKDLSLIDKNLVNRYITSVNIDETFEPLLFNYGTSIININNTNNANAGSSEFKKLITEENFNSNVNIKFTIDFQLIMKDDLPVYMENLTGLVFKKLFYNLK